MKFPFKRHSLRWCLVSRFSLALAAIMVVFHFGLIALIVAETSDATPVDDTITFEIAASIVPALRWEVATPLVTPKFSAHRTVCKLQLVSSTKTNCSLQSVRRRLRLSRMGCNLARALCPPAG
ncbi:hypothetical protein GR138_10775 [Shinella kummerowiae]|uniref:Uncharacterized protein n=1 Tax=Shinella kummerowiae TaxID=417745 RepID=A0A6N8SB57_9HYPH|nr:hypothetical protein [Shinella kummerowiae]MXN45677.1 hypothetical protein [Shinella kummerowiae]